MAETKKENMPTVDSQYQRLIEARNFHYDNLNKWLITFYAIIGALFLALYTLHASEHLHRHMELCIAIVGYVVSLGALLSIKGYYYWEYHWIERLYRFERQVYHYDHDELQVYSAFADKVKHDNPKRLIDSANVSTTKVSLFITLFVTVLWGMMIIYFSNNLWVQLGRCVVIPIATGISFGLTWLLMWGGSKWLNSDIEQMDDLKHPQKKDKMETKKCEANSNRERNLKIVFWILGGIVLVMLILFLVVVGIHSNFSQNPADYANFSTYIGAIGTMLFTALYAYAFIQLQGAVKNNTQAQEERNHISIKKDEDGKVKKNLIFMLTFLESSIQGCLEKINSIVVRKENLSSEQHEALRTLLYQSLENARLLDSYYQQHRLFSGTKIDTQLMATISEIINNVEICIATIDKWYNEGKNNKAQIKDLLTKSAKLAKQLEIPMISSMF